MATQGEYFFGEQRDDEMAKQNARNWDAIVAHVSAAHANRWLPRSGGWTVLDIGCHTGGLLWALKKEFDTGILNSCGVEPLDRARKAAQSSFRSTQFFKTLDEVKGEGWCDVIVSHESLYFFDDLDAWSRTLKRLLNPRGAAFIALGSHDENDAWMRWRGRLSQLYGHESFVHRPMDILRAGHEAGFEMWNGPLHTKPVDNIRYSPPQDGWGEFHSVEEQRRFHNEWKQMFTYYPVR